MLASWIEQSQKNKPPLLGTEFIIRGTTHFDSYPLYKYGPPFRPPIPSSSNGEEPFTPTEITAYFQ